MSFKDLSFKPNIKKDAVAGIIVFLIALPLCLGIAQASQAPLFSGVIAGIIGGIVIGYFSKSHLSVSGPAAGLVAIVVGALQELPTFEIFLCAVIIAGALQLLFGFLKAGGIANYFPINVIEGMLAGIGLTIILKQLPDAMGYVNKKFLAGLDPTDDGFNTENIAKALEHIQPGAVIITVLGISILALWQSKTMQRWKMIPAGLLVVLLGVFLNFFFSLVMPQFYLDPSHLVALPVPDSMADFFRQFALPDFSGFLNPAVWQTGLVLAIVASIETLLCIEATDKMDPHKRFTSGNAELRAQGIGNMMSGLIGGLPITSVIVRSTANINAGAESKRSTMIHGVLLLVCAATIPAWLNFIPKASLAAILLFTGFRLCRPAIFKHIWKEGGRSQFIPFVVTVVAIMFTDLLRGVGLGLVFSVLYLLRQNINIPYYFHRTITGNGDVIKLKLAQEVSFLNKASIKETLKNIPKNSTLHLDATESEYIDYDVLTVIKDFKEGQAKDKNINLSLTGFRNIYKLSQAEESHATPVELTQDASPSMSYAGGYKKLIKQLKGGDKMEK